MRRGTERNEIVVSVNLLNKTGERRFKRRETGRREIVGKA